MLRVLTNERRVLRVLTNEMLQYYLRMDRMHWRFLAVSITGPCCAAGGREAVGSGVPTATTCNECHENPNIPVNHMVFTWCL